MNSTTVEILRAGRARAAVDVADGGRLVSLTLDGVEVLGSERPKTDEPSGWFHGCFPMAPYVGRVAGARFNFEERDYILPANAGQDAGHGVVFDVPWQIAGPQTSTALSIETCFDERWPFGGCAEQEFCLSDSQLRITLTVRNGLRRMPVMMGFHPWFRRDIGTGAAAYDVRPGLRHVPSSNAYAGEFTTVLGTRPWDDVFTQFETPPSISWPGGPTLNLTSNSDTWVVFEQLENAFCIEPVSDPPGSLGAQKALSVGPGEEVEIWINIEWGAAQPAGRNRVSSGDDAS